jgi:proteasome lid subunit RPN8/RPN11
MADGIRIRDRETVVKTLADFLEPEDAVRFGEPRHDLSPVKLYLPARVLEEMLSHATSHREVEIGGYLFGHSYLSLDRAVVEVQGVYNMVSPDATVGHVRFDIESSRDAEQHQEVNHPDTEIVGWYHSHPGHGVFLSGTDQRTHGNFFKPFHKIAMVIDPIRREVGAYCGPDGRVVAMEAVYLTGMRPTVAQTVPLSPTGGPRQATSHSDGSAEEADEVGGDRTIADTGGGRDAGIGAMRAFPRASQVLAAAVAFMALLMILSVFWTTWLLHRVALVR